MILNQDLHGTMTIPILNMAPTVLTEPSTDSSSHVGLSGKKGAGRASGLKGSVKSRMAASVSEPSLAARQQPGR